MPPRFFASPRWLAAMAAIAFFVILLLFSDTRYQSYVPLRSDAGFSTSKIKSSDSLKSSPAASERVNNHGAIANADHTSPFISDSSPKKPDTPAAVEYNQLFPYEAEKNPSALADDPPDFSALFQSKSPQDVTAKLSGLSVPQVPEEKSHDSIPSPDSSNPYPLDSEAYGLYEASHSTTHDSPVSPDPSNPYPPDSEAYGLYEAAHATSTTEPFLHAATDLPPPTIADGIAPAIYDAPVPTTLLTALRPLATAALNVTAAAANLTESALSAAAAGVNASLALAEEKMELGWSRRSRR